MSTDSRFIGYFRAVRGCLTLQVPARAPVEPGARVEAWEMGRGPVFVEVGYEILRNEAFIYYRFNKTVT